VQYHLLQQNYFYYRLVLIAQSKMSVLVTPVTLSNLRNQPPLFTELRLWQGTLGNSKINYNLVRPPQALHYILKPTHNFIISSGYKVTWCPQHKNKISGCVSSLPHDHLSSMPPTTNTGALTPEQS